VTRLNLYYKHLQTKIHWTSVGIRHKRQPVCSKWTAAWLYWIDIVDSPNQKYR